MRNELRGALREIECGPQEVLHSTYLSSLAARYDAENVLLYNVGAAYFRRSCAAGLRFEATPRGLPAAPRPTAGEPRHYHRYQPAAWSGGFNYWTSGLEIVRWDMPCAPLTATADVASIWHLIKSSAALMEVSSGDSPSRFALRVLIDAPEWVRFNCAALVKPVFDGIVCALHVHDGSMLGEVGERLAARLGTDPTKVVGGLMDDRIAVLGKRRLLWPWRHSVQWNPADDLCLAGELLIRRGQGHTWRLAGKLLALDP